MEGESFVNSASSSSWIVRDGSGMQQHPTCSKPTERCGEAMYIGNDFSRPQEENSAAAFKK
jgi:hypothetical protein